VKTLVYWFRHDLRITDNPAFSQACAKADFLIPIYVFDPLQDSETEWKFYRIGHHRQAFLRESLDDLKQKLNALGSDLFEFTGDIQTVISSVLAAVAAQSVYCEQIEAPEALEQVSCLMDLKIDVKQIWQSSMLEPQTLPFAAAAMPDVFTVFRQKIENEKIKFASPIPKVTRIPPLPVLQALPPQTRYCSPRSSPKNFVGGQTAAELHINQYFDRRLPDTYKQTRNQLLGMDYSSKFSPWLSLGCVSARTIAAKLEDYESKFGANDGTYWLWFELLWRDYFRFLHFKYGLKLYRKTGLGDQAPHKFDRLAFSNWSGGCTGEGLIDAGMRELSLTGYLSNRLRQVVASYWIHEMNGDWRAGAAWFESQLIDYDVYSNQGNWLYIAGCGTDPRGGRAFNVAKQTRDHDGQGHYQRLWLQQTNQSV
jgi:deoxyribodipyrimidine photo-lyase